MSLHQPLIEAARQLCAVQNGSCGCRDECDMGTCTPMIKAARSAILTFLAHPETGDATAIMETYSELKDCNPS